MGWRGCLLDLSEALGLRGCGRSRLVALPGRRARGGGVALSTTCATTRTVSARLGIIGALGVIGVLRSIGDRPFATIG